MKLYYAIIFASLSLSNAAKVYQCCFLRSPKTVDNGNTRNVDGYATEAAFAAVARPVCQGKVGPKNAIYQPYGGPEAAWTALCGNVNREGVDDTNYPGTIHAECHTHYRQLDGPGGSCLDK